MRRIVVVGNGMVGARFADEVRRRGGARLTVVGAETHPAYNRVLLSTVLAGGIDPAAIALPVADHVDVRSGTAAVSLHPATRTLTLADGTPLPYDDLVLATGSRAWLPPVAGVPGPGVVGFRDLDDCLAILDMARPGARLVVLGGGLLGLEAARGLAARGVEVTVVHPAGHLMERQLDAGAGAVLAEVVAELGVQVQLGVGAVSWAAGTGLTCDDGTVIAADGLVVAAGVRAETTLASDAGARVDRGIVVDDRLRTSLEHVYAIGDCAQHDGAPAGLVQPGWDQAAVLADLLTGADPTARYRGTRAVTRLKASGIDLTAVGDVHADDDTVELLRLTDSRRGRYAKLALRDDRVVGGIMIGFPDAAASMIQLHDNGSPAPSDRLALLLGRALPGEATPTSDPGHLPAAAVVCRCNTVTKGSLVAAWRAGATDLTALRGATRAATGCGSCAGTVEGICAWLAATDTPAPTRDESHERPVAAAQLRERAVRAESGELHERHSRAIQLPDCAVRSEESTHERTEGAA
ncbi:FAD/NAD(P)-binding oxidoreductase [Pseudonocardia sulfidoxydans NBRC 16205]|uniref:FAD/NAD(P)-binding oxidoreductase n=1 Tax=Pseudonocardia sulfidoxydans NBRC 16205 TaxID=1223511 RepID=A0A511DL17_9PSEU|nr:FAD-dependent oxidoreductase [Pseudonocardia sulfidoxydans]GEL25506.1 FAD/NAD(P)-binding oxidoreductase [Pseudonocardia sulfidoxydans NBRC 16205]